MLLQSVSKQWGKILGDTVNLKIINFPVSFNECFGGLALFNGDPVAAAEYATITDITNTNFKIYMYANNAGTGYANANIFYLFLGAQQQWGNSWSGYTGVFNWYFPISPSQVYAACLTKHTKNISSSHNWEPARVEEWNNSYARIHPDGDLGYSVIAICKAQQQWGINTGGAVRTSTLPIPFTNVFLAVASTSSEWCCPGCSATNTTVTTRAYQSNRPDVAQPNDVNWIIIGCQPQWRNNPGLWAIPFTEFVAGGITMTRTGSQSSGAWYGDSGTISLTGYTASCATNESWVSNISGSAIAVGL